MGGERGTPRQYISELTKRIRVFRVDEGWYNGMICGRGDFLYGLRGSRRRGPAQIWLVSTSVQAPTEAPCWALALEPRWSPCPPPSSHRGQVPLLSSQFAKCAVGRRLAVTGSF